MVGQHVAKYLKRVAFDLLRLLPKHQLSGFVYMGSLAHSRLQRWPPPAQCGYYAASHYSNWEAMLPITDTGLENHMYRAIPKLIRLSLGPNVIIKGKQQILIKMEDANLIGRNSGPTKEPLIRYLCKFSLLNLHWFGCRTIHCSMICSTRGCRSHDELGSTVLVFKCL